MHWEYKQQQQSMEEEDEEEDESTCHPKRVCVQTWYTPAHHPSD